MGSQIIIKEKENNQVAVWSSVVDDFIFEGDIDNYINLVAEEAKQEKIASLKKVYDKLSKGENVYYQFQMSYKEACELRNLYKKEE
jgi:hypothetical protein